MISGKNYIGNTLVAGGSVSFQTFNPKLNLPNSKVHYEATDEEINRAVELASEAFKQFRSIGGKEKAAFLNAIADEILALDKELIDTYCAETGLPEGRAMGERGRTVSQLRSFADLVEQGGWVEATIDTAIPDRAPVPKPDLRKMLIPLGPVVVFGASNFPLAYSTAGGDTAAALAAGCPVIVKSHPMHAGTGELVASAIVKAAKATDMPDGVFSNLNSKGIEVGVTLVQHPGVKAVGFTGSIRGGRALFDLAASREEPIPVFAEMGSINPVVLMADALRDRGAAIATQYAGSITLGTGQFCTNPGLLLAVEGPELDSFVSELAAQIATIDPSCMLHPNIQGAYEANKELALQQSGVEVVSHYDGEVATNYARQAVARVDGKTFRSNPRLHQEVFGPYSMVVACADLNELEELLYGLEGQLTGTLIGEPAETAANPGIVSALQNRVGRLIFNGVPTGVEVCPSMLHGGPYPASTDSRFTAVGIHSIKRWVRPFSYQSWPDTLLPAELQNANPLGIDRLVNGQWTNESI